MIKRRIGFVCGPQAQPLTYQDRSGEDTVPKGGTRRMAHKYTNRFWLGFRLKVSYWVWGTEQFKANRKARAWKQEVLRRLIERGWV